MFAKIVALFALVAVAFAAPNPKPAPAPAPQVLAYSAGLDYVYPSAYSAYPAYSAPVAYSAPLAYSAYDAAVPGIYLRR